MKGVDQSHPFHKGAQATTSACRTARSSASMSTYLRMPESSCLQAVWSLPTHSHVREPHPRRPVAGALSCIGPTRAPEDDGLAVKGQRAALLRQQLRVGRRQLAPCARVTTPTAASACTRSRRRQRGNAPAQKQHAPRCRSHLDSTPTMLKRRSVASSNGRWYLHAGREVRVSAAGGAREARRPELWTANRPFRRSPRAEDVKGRGRVKHGLGALVAHVSPQHLLRPRV